jgi:hypothetical protein
MIRYFDRHKVFSMVLAVILSITTMNFACNTNWINTVNQYLPLALQIAQSIASLVAVFSPNVGVEDTQAVAAISQEAVKDWQLVQSLIQQYQATPSATTQAALENALNTLVTSLPAMLAAAHVKDQTLLTKVTAAVNILVTIADAIISQIPVKTSALQTRKAMAKVKASAYSPSAAKGQWDTLVCGGNPSCTAMVH